MRLLHLNQQGQLALTKDLPKPAGPYTILSHTWGKDEDEVTFEDLEKTTETSGKRSRRRRRSRTPALSVKNPTYRDKAGYTKLRFCIDQAQKDGLEYCWIDTCCINKANNAELSEAITSMFRWYQDATKCYVYLADVSAGTPGVILRSSWESAFQNSRWFTRGWTLQELLAPACVEFFSAEGRLLGTKQTLEALVYGITNVPVAALRGTALSTFTVDERFRWSQGRSTRKIEDEAYCLLGIFSIFMPLIYGEGKNATIRLREEIEKGADSVRSSSPTHWIVPRAANTLFTGREDVLQDLGSVISQTINEPLHQEQCRIVISGIGGQGKSEICLQLAHRFRPKFWGVFWIDVSTTLIAEQGILGLAHTLSLPAQTWQEACLGIANLKQSWLLVLDNADDVNMDYQPFIPSSPRGVVIISSRNDACHRHASSRAIPLKPLSDDAAQALLLKAAQIPEDQYAEYQADTATVSELLQSHPLALIQAGAYVSQGYCLLREYPAEYERQRGRLLRFHLSQAQSRYHDVYATFEASAEVLERAKTAVANDALELLPMLAVCGPRRIPLALFKAGWEGAQYVSSDPETDADDPETSLLTSWHVSYLPGLVDVSANSWDAFRLLSAINLLKSLALVTVEGTDETRSVSMHTLVHAWARDRQSADEQHTTWLAIGCVMAFAQWGNGLSRALDGLLQSHVESVVDWDMRIVFGSAPPTLVARVLVNCGFLLNQMRGDTKLCSLVQGLLSWLGVEETTIEPSSLGVEETTIEPSLLGVYDLMSRNLINLGMPWRAIQLLEQVVAARKVLFGPDHGNQAYQLSSQHDLATAYQANGQIAEAVSLLEEVVEIRKQTLAETHPNRLVSQHALAGAYEANGQRAEAVSLLEEVVEIQKQTLTETHPSRLASQHALAGAYKANGQIAEAVLLLEEVVEIRKQTLTETHPSRLASQHALAGAYDANGQRAEAVSLLEEVVEIQKQTLTETHPDRLVSEHNLAICLWDCGCRSRGLQMMLDVVAIHQRILDAAHPDRQNSEDWLRIFNDTHLA